MDVDLLPSSDVVCCAPLAAPSMSAADAQATARLFKALAVTAPGLAPPPGFEMALA